MAYRARRTRKPSHHPRDDRRASRKPKRCPDSGCNCRALINHIIAGLSAEGPFINISTAAELLLYLEFAASSLKETRQIPPTHVTWH
jgi:hypothetical protein